MPPPALPTSFRVEIGQEGNLIIRWKASNPASGGGTAYIVERRLNGAGAFGFLGAAGGDKTFDDTTIPGGTSQVEYRVRGQRSGVSGPAAIWTVRFGVGGGGGGLTIAAQYPGTEDGGAGVKMAA
ncbi:MAG: fibronectin type III domain-containing protein [Phycisphaerales bacterium]